MTEAPTRPEAIERAEPPRCPGCGYDLEGTLEDPQQRCPECGRAWTVEELALQRVARSSEPQGALERAVWMLGPGWLVLMLAFFAVVAGPPLGYLLVLGAIGLAVVVVIGWARGLYEASFRRARTAAARFVFVVGGTVGIALLNLAQIALAAATLNWIVSRVAP